MHELHVDGRRYLQFDHLRRDPLLVHAYSTKPLDCRLRDGNHAADGIANRAAMIRDLGVDPNALRYSRQIHKPNLVIVDEHTPPGGIDAVDGMITRSRDIPLMAFSADCPLIIAYDPRRSAVGVVHSSWRCTVAHATGRLIELMRDELGCEPADLLAGIGPSAGPLAYEVGQDVIDAAATRLPDHERFFRRRDGRLYFDLWAANRAQLEEAGVQPAHIEVARLCTMTRTDLFYSYRVEGAATGRFVALVALRHVASGRA